MSQEFTFSDPGEGLQEAEILEVHVSSGDSVSDGDVVLTVETDKANTDVSAPFEGTIDEVRISTGDMVEVGDVLMTYNEGGEADTEDGDSEQSEESDSSDQNDAGQDQESAESNPEASEQNDASDTNDASNQQKGQSSSKSEESNKQKEVDESSESNENNKQQPVPAAPSTRRVAREKGVNLHDIKPSGDHGRVTTEDVEAAAGGQKAQHEEKTQTQTSPLSPATAPPDLPDFTQWGETEREPLRSIRRATARNMAKSWAQIPHVYHQDIADVTALERFRQAHEVEHGKLTITVLVMKALVDVLKRFPRFNATLDVQNQEIIYKHYFHIGLAVATERGLLVPTIRDVDQKSVTELAAEAADVARKTRNGELSAEQMRGGSITVTNPGPMGGSSLTPLINHPQVAILGMARTRLEPVAEGTLDDYRITTRLHMPLVLGFDHRVNDGADAARFVTALIDTLADPESLLLVA